MLRGCAPLVSVGNAIEQTHAVHVAFSDREKNKQYVTHMRISSI